MVKLSKGDAGRLLASLFQELLRMKILLAIDGSGCSQDVINSALALRCKAGSEIMVFSAVDYVEPLPSMEGLKEKEIKAIEGLVEETVVQLRKTHPHAVVTGAVADGYAADEILKKAKEWQADLIMVGSHGRSGIEYLLLGSVSRRVFLEAPCAVRIVRRRSDEHIKNDVCHVILALDDSEHSEKLIEHVLEFPWSANVSFKCIHVVPKDGQKMLSDADGMFGQMLVQHYTDIVAGKVGWLEAASAKLNNAFGKKVASADVLRGDTRKVVMDLAKNWPADLIMVGSHGRRGIEKAVLGSVSEAVATHACCSVEMTRLKNSINQKVHIIV